MTQIVIRASALNAIPDCEARAAIPLFYGAVEIRHFRRKKARGEVQ